MVYQNGSNNSWYNRIYLYLRDGPKRPSFSGYDMETRKELTEVFPKYQEEMRSYARIAFFGVAVGASMIGIGTLMRMIGFTIDDAIMLAQELQNPTLREIVQLELNSFNSDYTLAGGLILGGGMFSIGIPLAVWSALIFDTSNIQRYYRLIDNKRE